MLGFIGAGNMAGAILSAAARKNVFPAEELAFCELNAARAEQLERELGVRAVKGARALAELSDVVLLGVKPNGVAAALSEAGDALDGKAIISIAAGWTSEALAKAAPKARVLRVMPNTPAMVGEGMAVLSKSHTLREDEAALAERLFGAVGKYAWIEERLMEACTGLSGSGPAYVFMFIEALADGGVLCGLPRALAQELAAQTVLGAAKLAVESGKHPGELKDMVCSPGGTTIAAVRTLEERGFRAAAMDAVISATEKAAQMRGN